MNLAQFDISTAFLYRQLKENEELYVQYVQVLKMAGEKYAS